MQLWRKMGMLGLTVALAVLTVAAPASAMDWCARDPQVPIVIGSKQYIVHAVFAVPRDYLPISDEPVIQVLDVSTRGNSATVSIALTGRLKLGANGNGNGFALGIVNGNGNGNSQAWAIGNGNGQALGNPHLVVPHRCFG